SFAAHAVAVLGVDFDPGGGRLASSGFDRQIKLWDATPLTQEGRAHHEAWSLVTYLFHRGLSEVDVSARIREDHSIGDAVRRLALALVEPQNQSIRRQAAFFQVWSAISTGHPKQDILNEVRNNKKITDQL